MTALVRERYPAQTFGEIFAVFSSIAIARDALFEHCVRVCVKSNPQAAQKKQENRHACAVYPSRMKVGHEKTPEVIPTPAG